MFEGCIKPKFVCVIYFYMEFYMPCVDYSCVITLKALYEILIVAGLSYTAQVLQVLHIFQHYYALHFIEYELH